MADSSQVPTVVNTTERVEFGPKKAPHHRNKGRWLNKSTSGARVLNGVYQIGAILQKKELNAKDYSTLAGIFGVAISNAEARITIGHWRHQLGEKCLLFNDSGNVIGTTDVPQPDYLPFDYGTGSKRWKREGMNKKVKVVGNNAP